MDEEKRILFRDELIALLNKHGVYIAIMEIGDVEEGFYVAALEVVDNKLFPVLSRYPTPD